MSKLNLGIPFSLLILFAGIFGFAQDSTTPLQLSTPYPTFHNLAIEWTLLGDAPDCGAYEAGQDLPHYGPRL